MADSLTKTGAADRSRININEDYEVEYWTRRLGVSRDQLVRAVHKVGPIAADVLRELGK
jgi:hypothetical protein